jgi:GT2 family glycosyltransferase
VIGLWRRDRITKDVLPIDSKITYNLRRFREGIDKSKVINLRRPKNFTSKIEIIIPCYNHGAYLKSALNSLSLQTWLGKLTVTIINDKSTDNSLIVMKKLRQNNRSTNMDIRIIDNKTNLNQAGSINRAVNDSKNELFIILNADDMLTPDCIELIVETYKKHPDLWLLGGSSLWFVDEKELPVHRMKPINKLNLTVRFPKQARKYSQLSDLNMSQSSCSFFKGAWELVGGYLPREQRVCSFDDRDFQMRVNSLLPVGIYSEYPMEFYRTSSSQGKAIS